MALCPEPRLMCSLAVFHTSALGRLDLAGPGPRALCQARGGQRGSKWRLGAELRPARFPALGDRPAGGEASTRQPSTKPWVDDVGETDRAELGESRLQAEGTRASSDLTDPDKNRLQGDQPRGTSCCFPSANSTWPVSQGPEGGKERVHKEEPQGAPGRRHWSSSWVCAPLAGRAEMGGSISPRSEEAQESPGSPSSEATSQQGPCHHLFQG